MKKRSISIISFALLLCATAVAATSAEALPAARSVRDCVGHCQNGVCGSGGGIFCGCYCDDNGYPHCGCLI